MAVGAFPDEGCQTVIARLAIGKAAIAPLQHVIAVAQMHVVLWAEDADGVIATKGRGKQRIAPGDAA